MTDVFTFGECMLSLRSVGALQVGGTVRTSVVGAESNVAVGLARLGHNVRWTGRVGDDAAGSLVLRTLQAEGVRTDGVVVDIAPTGVILFEPRPPIGTRVDYHRAASAGSRITPDDVLAAIAAGPRVLHVTGVTAALSSSAAEAVHQAVLSAREAGVRVSLDVNYRSRLWSREEAAAVLRPLVRHVDLVIASEDEVGILGDSVEALRGQGVPEVVVKRGSRGADVHLAGTEPRRWSAPALSVDAVDPVGAGDAFTAGYLSAWLDGLDPAARLARGNALGAFAVSNPGDWEGLPTRSELALLGAGDGVVLR